MPPGSLQYTLVGFSEQLDWRPLIFLKPLPANRVCSACGLVRPRTALLPCAHTLCESCYEQSAEGGPHVCPLDSHECHDEDVDWRVYPASELLKRQVKCWNEGSGCQYAAAAVGIVEHFRSDCKHHSACCPKCSSTVLCCDVVGHLKSGSCKSAAPLDSDGQAQPEHKNETFLTLCRGSFGEQAREAKELLGRIAGDVSIHADRLNEISHAINSFKESVRQELAAVTKQNDESLALVLRHIEESKEEVKCSFTSRIDTPSICRFINRFQTSMKNKLSEIENVVQAAKGEANETNQITLDHTKSILRHVELGVAQCEFFVKNVALLHATAMQEGCAEYVSERVYLRGYCLSPGVDFENNGSRVSMCATICIHQGHMDDFLHWPFEHKIKLTVIHPVKDAELAVEEKAIRSHEFFQRPTILGNEPCVFNARSLDLKVLISEGYVENDQLRVKLYLYP